MQLSPLQRYILKRCFGVAPKRLPRRGLEEFYRAATRAPKQKDQVDSVTKSIERLIQRGLVIGWGERTAEKWFIRELRLTPRGRAVTRTLFGQQQKLKI